MIQTSVFFGQKLVVGSKLVMKTQAVFVFFLDGTVAAPKNSE